MARYLSRELQRTIAQLALDSDLSQDQLKKLADSIERNNGAEPRAFLSYLENQNARS